MHFFIAYQYEKPVPGGTMLGLGNCVRKFDFHPLNDPARAGREIAADNGLLSASVLNVQPCPGNEG